MIEKEVNAIFGSAKIKDPQLKGGEIECQEFRSLRRDTLHPLGSLCGRQVSDDGDQFQMHLTSSTQNFSLRPLTLINSEVSQRCPTMQVRAEPTDKDPGIPCLEGTVLRYFRVILRGCLAEQDPSSGHWLSNNQSFLLSISLFHPPEITSQINCTHLSPVSTAAVYDRLSNSFNVI